MVEHPLRKLRDELDLTLQQMALETGASKTKIWRVEHRRQDADLALIRQAVALAKRKKKDLRVDDFLGVPPVEAVRP